MAQNVPRLQHYVPQLLLKQFAQPDGKLWAYDSENQKMFCTSPKALAAEGDFYGDPALERWLSREIEAPGAAAIQKLLERRELSTEQIKAFFVFVAAQMQRTPANLERMASTFAPEFQEIAERMAKYDLEFRSNVLAAAKAAGDSDPEIEEFKKLLDEGAFQVEPTREFTIGAAFQVLELLANELRKMCWTFLEVYPTDPNLIIGDHPVTLADVGPDGTPVRPLGVKNPNIELVMPLGSRFAALAHWDGPISYGVLGAGMAERLNERMLQHAHRFVYASFESPDLLQKAISLRGTGPRTRVHRISVGDKLLMVSVYS